MFLVPYLFQYDKKERMWRTTQDYTLVTRGNMRLVAFTSTEMARMQWRSRKAKCLVDVITHCGQSLPSLAVSALSENCVNFNKQE